MNAINNGPQGGITGFQGNCIMWEFIRRWMHYEDTPMKLIKYSDMLYPQYRYKFEKTIPASTFAALQEKAKIELANDELADNKLMHPNVREHMERIVEGIVPFGYVVKED